MQPDEQRTVRLSAVPTTLYLRLHVHVDDVLRELAQLGVGDEYGLGPGWDRAWEQASAAQQAGREEVDIELCLPADAAEQLAALFEQADALARAGMLLAADSPTLREFRDWLVDELSHRLRDGDEP
jgi:N-acetylmuramoyl-L-alanine amidase CwlA